MGQEIFKEVAFKGYEPSEFVMFACGGAGPGHCCGVAAAADMKVCYVPPMASVFGAFGASTLDIVHKYERSHHLRLFDYATSTFLSDFTAFNAIVSELKDLAAKDIALEGFTESDANYSLELEMRYGMQWRFTHIKSPILFLKDAEDLKKICTYFTEEFGRMYGPEAAFPEAGIELEAFRLFVELRLPRAPFEQGAVFEKKPPEEAIKGERECYWEALPGLAETKIYDWSMLKTGNEIQGPAIIESKTTTIVVEPGWSSEMDEYRNVVLRTQSK